MSKENVLLDKSLHFAVCIVKLHKFLIKCLDIKNLLTATLKTAKNNKD